MGRPALRIAEGPPYYERVVDSWAVDSGLGEGKTHGGTSAHSVHQAIRYPDTLNPELAAYFIERYSEPGELVYDPFCRTGPTLFEAALRKRQSLGVDVSPLAARYAKAKLEPADITEITLFLQNVAVQRPIDLELYDEVFSPFYDIDTFRELVNLRDALHGRDDRVSRFVELIAASLLHGHSAGYFSVYSFPQISLLPDAQEDLNIRRRQIPDYRAVVPRILRKAALVTRDGIPARLIQCSDEHRVFCGDPRNTGQIGSGEVDLALSSPPLPGRLAPASELWLRLWFGRLSSDSLRQVADEARDLAAWKDFMNASLFELARVVRPGGRAVFDLRETQIHGKQVALDQVLKEMSERELARYWEPECCLVHQQPSTKLKNKLGERDERKRFSASRVLVLRRQ